MAVTGSSSPSPQNDDEQQHSQNPDPNPTQSHEPQQSPPSQPQPQPQPDSETLDLPNPLQSSIHDPEVQNSQQLVKDEDALLILGQQLKQKDDHQSGTSHSTLPEPIILTDDFVNPPLSSPINPQRRVNKRKKAGGRKRKRPRPSKRVQNLTDNLNPIPFVPTKALDFEKHEEVLKRLGFFDFCKIEFDGSIRTELIVQLIMNYDSKKRCSYVNERRIRVNRADLARALKLPAPKQDKGSTSVDEVDLDSEVFSDEAIAFIDDFVSSYMLLHENSWVMPTEITNWIRCIKDGHPEKMDSASLIWYMVEKELTQGDKLSYCYYASHLQHLIKSQCDSIFIEDDYDGAEDDCEEIVKVDEDKEVKQEFEEKQEEEVDEEKQEKEVNGENKENQVNGVNEETEEKQEKEVNGENEEKQVNGVNEENEETQEKEVKDHDIEMSLGPDVEELLHDEVNKDDEFMVDAEECNEMEEQGMQNNVLQRCQSNDLNNVEERKAEEVEDEQIEQLDDEDEEEEEEEEQEHEHEQEEEVEEEGGEQVDEGFEIGPNDDSMDRDGLTDNFLGVETHNIPFNSHGMSSMDLFGSKDNSFMSHGGPFFNNGGKRVMEPEEAIHNLDINNKRLKTEEIWGEKQNDFSVCMGQMQQLMEKAKMIYDSKEQSFHHLHMTQQIALNEMNEHQEYYQMVIKTKSEELEKKNAEVFRLERELYLMTDLLSGYKKALSDTRWKFSEYRKRYALQEEPLYKDAGPGGLVLSTRELEKRQLKLEEDMRGCQMLAKDFEEEWGFQMKMHEEKVLSMFDKLVSISNEVKLLKEISTQRKEKQKPLDENVKSGEIQENQKSLDEQDLSLKEEENQKSEDEIVKNDASMESVSPHADESEEKKDGEDQIGQECR